MREMNGKKFLLYFFGSAILIAALAAGLGIWSFRGKDVEQIRLEAATSGRKAITTTQSTRVP